MFCKSNPLSFLFDAGVAFRNVASSLKSKIRKSKGKKATNLPAVQLWQAGARMD